MERFHTKSIQRIMKIKMSQVIDEKNANIKVRKSFFNIVTIAQTIYKQQLKLIGRIIRMDVKNTPKQLLTAANRGKRNVGRPSSTTRTAMLKNIKKLFLSINDDDNIKKWSKYAHDKTLWSWISKKSSKHAAKISYDWELPTSPSISLSSNKKHQQDNDEHNNNKTITKH